MQNFFNVYRETSSSIIPTKTYEYDAGYDVYSDEDSVISSWNRKLISTNIRIHIPNYCYARVSPRSGLSCKGIDIGAGVIDSQYSGIIKILMINNSDNDFNVKKGDKIAQIILEKIILPNITEVSKEEFRFETDRKDKGFGSSGYSVKN